MRMGRGQARHLSQLRGTNFPQHTRWELLPQDFGSAFALSALGASSAHPTEVVWL